MTRSRRSLLASGAALLAGFAGCVGGNDAGGGDAETTTTPPSTGTTTTSTTTTPPSTSTTPTTPTTTRSTTTPATDTTTVDPEPALYEFSASGSVDGTTVTPTGANAQCSTFYLTTPDQMGVIDPDGARLLFVDVTVEGGAPDPSAFVLEAGGRTHRGWTEYSGESGLSLAPDDRRGQAYRPEKPTGWVGFKVPVGPGADEFRLRLDREGSPAWVLPADATDTLRAGEPAFEVQSIEVPDATDSPAAIPFAITVENTGQGPGTFRFSVNYRGPTYAPARQRIDLGAGETRTRETQLDPYGTSGASAVEFAVTTATDEWEYTVEVERGGDG